MRIPIALSAYRRDAGHLPELRLRNLIVEKTPADDEGVVLLSRPGLTASTTLAGSSDVKAVWCQPGVFSGQTIALSGFGAYLGATLLGTLTSAASAGARFAANNAEAVFSNDGVLYRTDGVTLSQPTFPDGAQVASVAILDNFFLAVRKDSGKLYWSAVGDGTSWPALNFATAEARPDKLLDVLAINDQIALLGEESVEFWQPNPTSSPDLPFTRIDGLTYSKGLLNTGAAAYADNTLVWVGNDGIVYRRSAVPLRISDHGIEEQIRKAGSAYLFAFAWAGHSLLAITLPSFTYLYDFATQEWGDATTYGIAGWLAQCGCGNGLAPVFGDRLGPYVLGLDDSTLYDRGLGIERRFTAYIGKPTIIDNVILDAQAGIGSEPSGDPILMELAVSRDGGQTFSEYIQTDLGRRGEYRKRAAWRRLGAFEMGAVLDFRTTDPALFSIQSVRVNETLAGRGI